VIQNCRRNSTEAECVRYNCDNTESDTPCISRLENISTEIFSCVFQHSDVSLSFDIRGDLSSCRGKGFRVSPDLKVSIEKIKSTPVID